MDNNKRLPVLMFAAAAIGVIAWQGLGGTSELSAQVGDGDGSTGGKVVAGLAPTQVIRGSQNVPIGYFTIANTLRAPNNIRVNFFKVRCSGGCDTLSNIKLVTNNGTMIGGTVPSFTNNEAFFLSEFVIDNKVTETFTVRGDIGRIGPPDNFRVDLSDVRVVDANGRNVKVKGLPVRGSNYQLVSGAVGNVSVRFSGVASEESRVVLFGNQVGVIGEFDVSASVEDMRVDSMMLGVSSRWFPMSTSSLQSSVGYIEVYDGTTLLGERYILSTSTNSIESIVQMTNLNWVIPRNTLKTLVVKGYVYPVSAYSAYGNSKPGTAVFVTVHPQNFSAVGMQSGTIDTVIDKVKGLEYFVFKSKPTFTLSSPQPSYTIKTVPSPVLKFRVAANAVGAISWRKLQFVVNMTDADMVAAATSGVVRVRDVTSGGTQLSLSNALSHTNITGSGSVPITAGSGGYVDIELANEEVIAPGTYKEYELYLTFNNIASTPAGSDPRLVIGLSSREELNESIIVGTYSSVAGSDLDTNQRASTIWSDRSASPHSVSSPDWTNGRYADIDSRSVFVRD